MKALGCIMLLVFFASCEETISFEGTESQRQIVVNSIISTDSTWNVDLSYSQSIFDDGVFELIDDARVRVTNLTSGQSFFLKNKGNGSYKRSLNPTEGHSYALEITTNDNRTANAETYVPSVLKVHVVKNHIVDNSGKQAIEIDIEIEDNPDEHNFYVWEIVENKYDETVIEEDTGDHNDLTPPQAGESQTDGELKSLNSPLFLSDDEFNGKVYNTRLTLGDDVLSALEYPPVNDEGEGRPRFNLRIMAVSKDLFEYLRTYELYKQTDIKVTSITQPTDVYSNIENGLGIFGGYNLKEFPIE